MRVDAPAETRAPIITAGAGLEWPEEERARDVEANVSGRAAELGELVESLERQAA